MPEDSNIHISERYGPKLGWLVHANEPDLSIEDLAQKFGTGEQNLKNLFSGKKWCDELAVTVARYLGYNGPAGSGKVIDFEGIDRAFGSLALNLKYYESIGDILHGYRETRTPRWSYVTLGRIIYPDFQLKSYTPYMGRIEKGKRHLDCLSVLRILGRLSNARGAGNKEVGEIRSISMHDLIREAHLETTYPDPRGTDQEQAIIAEMTAKLLGKKHTTKRWIREETDRQQGR